MQEEWLREHHTLSGLSAAPAAPWQLWEAWDLSQKTLLSVGPSGAQDGSLPFAGSQVLLHKVQPHRKNEKAHLCKMGIVITLPH